MTKEEKQDAAPSAPEPEADEEQIAEPDAEELLDRLLRLQAEFENYRKRLARERSEWTVRAVESLVLDLLPALDSFDRAIESAGETDDPAALLSGMMLVKKQLLGALERQGVEAIEALGEPFDPNLHEGFMSRPAEPGEKPGTIVTEVEKGYRLGERTIRATKGIVAATEKDQGPEPGPEEE